MFFKRKLICSDHDNLNKKIEDLEKKYKQLTEQYSNAMGQIMSLETVNRFHKDNINQLKEVIDKINLEKSDLLDQLIAIKKLYYEK